MPTFEVTLRDGQRVALAATYTTVKDVTTRPNTGSRMDGWLVTADGGAIRRDDVTTITPA